ncbi:hypothetical protein CKO28_02945 [Rhodovibrio sodomensis]|uniref:Lipoprotein n=1 Tax=Rhodovibrio sodomensis TaxID=1088 RepID=A0ABS1D9I0_9PROT|nr:hypothetical protein [Rhodovibrio sodomensis]MBK1667000.1 hypothetical protein [Rhodovibrio sodomensis]
MTKTLTALTAAALLLTGCGASTSGNLTIDPQDIQYVQDSRTGLCFAFVGSGKKLDPDTSGVAMSNVPCSDKVMALIEG